MADRILVVAYGTPTIDVIRVPKTTRQNVVTGGSVVKQFYDATRATPLTDPATTNAQNPTVRALTVIRLQEPDPARREELYRRVVNRSFGDTIEFVSSDQARDIVGAESSAASDPAPPLPPLVIVFVDP